MRGREGQRLKEEHNDCFSYSGIWQDAPKSFVINKTQQNQGVEPCILL
jgi:hypothetical protein